MRQIDYVSTTALTPIDPYTQHGGGFKKLVAVAAVIAILIAAPTIAASIGLSGVIGSVMVSGLVGAGLGAVAGQITGQGATKGALMGALSGGAAGKGFNPEPLLQMVLHSIIRRSQVLELDQMLLYRCVCGRSANKYGYNVWYGSSSF